MASVSREAGERSSSRPIKAHSTFYNGYPLAGSYRFGQIQPHYVQEVVPDDDITMTSSFKLDSYTLGQQMMQDFFITHGYYFVPLPAILPRNYEKFITNPNIGEDIDADLVGLSYDFSKFDTFFTYLRDIFSEYYQQDRQLFGNLYLKYFVIFDMIFGAGGLPAFLGYKFLRREDAHFIDDFFQSIQSLITSLGISLRFNDSEGETASLSFREVLVTLHDSPSRTIVFSSSVAGNLDEFFSQLNELLSTPAGLFITGFDFTFFRRINVSRIIAYQLVCAHFFTNDHVDYIYSAELYRQNFYSSLIDAGLYQYEPFPYFVLNGERYEYDYLSGKIFSDLLEYNPLGEVPFINGMFESLRLLFGFNYSLRHVDYFTGSRTRPLAVGDVNVQVNNGYVNVVDTIQKNWAARFLNQVNRVGRRLPAYIKGLFPSAAISQDWHEPIWLGDFTEKVGSTESENTGASQASGDKNLIKSAFVSNFGGKGFEYHNTQYYGVLIGLVYFDIERFYPEVTERPIFHVDRNDMFNPFLQFNGDQEVYLNELFALPQSQASFSYQGRYKEYKERVPQCCGAFETDPVLSKSIFIADVDKIRLRDALTSRLSPSYIRSNPLEFDRFYTALTGLSLDAYYHFQIIHWNRVKSVRPMVSDPQLG